MVKYINYDDNEEYMKINAFKYNYMHGYNYNEYMNY